MNKRKYILVKKAFALSAALAFMVGTPAMAVAGGEKAKVKADTTATAKASNGAMLGVERKDANWFITIPDSLLDKRMLVTVRYISTPTGAGQYGGELVSQQTVYFSRLKEEKRILMRSDLLVNVSDSTDAINRAVLISNENPIIGSFPIASQDKNGYKINVTQFFNGDNTSLIAPSSLKRRFSLGALQPDFSYIKSIKSYPINTEVRLSKTWNSSGSGSYASIITGKVTMELNVSFLLLPDKPMPSRLFDPRVGYFTDQYTYFSDHQQRVSPRRFIVRWRLEPKDSADAERMKRGELVEPKKPIVYYIDPATPPKWRKYLKLGVEDWQKAFEKAGFKNAILARDWPENDSTMSMEDARYSVIRYLASSIENAYGPQIHDPRSGEILESHICWYHNVMTLVHDWYMIQAGTSDPGARKMRFDDELMGELIRFVSSHEVGHTLGLRHNFGSSSTVPVDSLRNRDWVVRHGHTPSIMDYARFNYVAQPEDSIPREGLFPRIGDYDMWAIQWGYTPTWKSYDEESDHWELEPMVQKATSGNRRVWFGDGETNPVNDPRCQTEDLGDDAVKAGAYGIKNLKRIAKQLPQWTYQSNDIYGRNLSSMYNAVVSQYQRYLGHVRANIGGVYNDYKTADEPGSIYSLLPRDKQRRALQFMADYLFERPSWLVDEYYIGRITSNPDGFLNGLGKNNVRYLVNAARRTNKEYPAADYLKDMSQMLFSGKAKVEAADGYSRALQMAFVSAIIDSFDDMSVTSELRPALLERLKSLRSMLASRHSSNPIVSAHYATMIDAIDRALVIK